MFKDDDKVALIYESILFEDAEGYKSARKGVSQITAAKLIPMKKALMAQIRQKQDALKAASPQGKEMIQRQIQALKADYQRKIAPVMGAHHVNVAKLQRSHLGILDPATKSKLQHYKGIMQGSILPKGAQRGPEYYAKKVGEFGRKHKGKLAAAGALGAAMYLTRKPKAQAPQYEEEE